MRLSQPVRVCSRSAGPVTKETPTAISMKAEKTTRTEVFADHVRQAHAVIAHREHAREEVVRSSHEDAAQHYPDIRHRSVCRAQNGSENGAETGYVEELDDEYPPGLHFLIVHPVGKSFCRSGA